ncbi:MAG: hypothetical protein ACI9UR_002848 [Bacteroidia bacterium]|jgi:hypothetical protein
MNSSQIYPAKLNLTLHNRQASLSKDKTFDRYRSVKTKTDVEAWELECKTYHEFKEINNFTNERHSKWPGKTGVEKLACLFEGCRL